MIDPSSRQQWLRGLITGTASIPEATDALRVLGWDTDEEPVAMTRADAAGMLRAYTGGRRSAVELQAWAEAIECREDIELAADAEDTLRDLVFELANPDINRSLTPAVAKEWLERLEVSP